MNIMVFNGLLLMLFMWTSAELELEKEPTGELQDLEYENESRMVMGPMMSWDPMSCRYLKGKCINGKRRCPRNLPLSTPFGRPYCSSKRSHCCYADEPTEPICGEGKYSNGTCFGEGQLCVKPLDAKCKKGYYCCQEFEDEPTEPICGEGKFSDGTCVGDGYLCVRPLDAKCAKGYCCKIYEVKLPPIVKLNVIKVMNAAKKKHVNLNNVNGRHSQGKVIKQAPALVDIF